MPALCRALCLALLICVSQLSACVSKQPEVSRPALSGEEREAADAKAARIWQRFVTQAQTGEVMTGPFRIAATLRYTNTAGDNTRVSSLLWGNGGQASPYPLRLDLLAGLGTVVAKVREDEGSFLAFSPEEKTAYAHDGGVRTLASFGVPVPLSLGDLTLLLTGRGGALFVPARARSESGTPAEHTLTAAGARFILPDARLPGELELSSTGAPLGWKELGGKGWTIAMEPGQSNPLQPRRLRISHPEGYSALIVVKEIARVSPPYSTSQMSLILPPNTDRKPLAEN